MEISSKMTMKLQYIILWWLTSVLNEHTLNNESKYQEQTK